jgi:hypothetical protein
MLSNGNRFSLVMPAVLVALTVLEINGCVSSGTYQAAKKQADDAQRELKRERDRMAAIEKVQTERKKQLDDLLVKLSGVTDRLDGISKSFGDLRNEVTRMRISRELEQGNKSSGISFSIEGEPPLLQLREESQPKPSVPAVDPKQRMKELLNNLHNLLEQGEQKVR